jgi:phosphomannomutase
VVGGEGNGGIILPDLHLTRDAPVGCALLLQHLLDEGIGLREAAERWPSYHIVKEKRAYPRERVGEAYGALAEGFGDAEANRDDGLRLDWPDQGSWLHVRPSGTEPVVRFIAEARDEEEARRLVTRAGEILGG